jgi:diaminohydroxyphosphoribosylaminopyrimidine deaminase / 5-amino-6-(5-phosphoribosylamino)uracil reductase
LLRTEHKTQDTKHHISLMRRCFELAQRGAGSVAPNPMVGAILIAHGRIIGQGWHERYGGPHAEVNAVRSVAASDRHLLSKAVLYCSLEPCSHYGKTPPCAELILEQKIPHVVVCNTDPNPLVAGRGINMLREAGVAVQTGLLEEEGQWLNRTFFRWITQKRPYIILKWAQSADGLIGRVGERTAVSGALTQRLVHRWRAESGAILVGTRTAVVDNPRLDHRLYDGPPLLRIALDWSAKLPQSANLLDDSQPTWIVGPVRDGMYQQTTFQYFEQDTWIPELLQHLYTTKKSILLVEGGASVHQQFIDAGLWDEVRTIENTALHLHSGVAAPILPSGEVRWQQEHHLGSDRICVGIKN